MSPAVCSAEEQALVQAQQQRLPIVLPPATSQMITGLPNCHPPTLAILSRFGLEEKCFTPKVALSRCTPIKSNPRESIESTMSCRRSSRRKQSEDAALQDDSAPTANGVRKRSVTRRLSLLSTSSSVTSMPELEPMVDDDDDSMLFFQGSNNSGLLVPNEVSRDGGSDSGFESLSASGSASSPDSPATSTISGDDMTPSLFPSAPPPVRPSTFSIAALLAHPTASATNEYSVDVAAQHPLLKNNDDEVAAMALAAVTAQEVTSDEATLACMWEQCCMKFVDQDQRLDHLLQVHVDPIQPVGCSSETDDDPAKTTRKRRSNRGEPSSPTTPRSSNRYQCKVKDCNMGREKGNRMGKYLWLRDHVIEKHGGAKPHRCLIEGCHHRFSTKNSLNLHLVGGHDPAKKPRGPTASQNNVGATTVGTAAKKKRPEHRRKDHVGALTIEIGLQHLVGVLGNHKKLTSESSEQTHLTGAKRRKCSYFYGPTTTAHSKQIVKSRPMASRQTLFDVVKLLRNCRQPTMP